MSLRQAHALLLQHLLGMSRTEYLLALPVNLTASQQKSYQALIERLEAGEPVSKITGCRAFWKHDFIVNQHTLDPRPETELVIEAVLKYCPNHTIPYHFLDLGTGSGCILLSLLHEYPNAQGQGIDVSPEAIAVAKKNSELLDLNKRAFFESLDWTFMQKRLYDVVVSNPPYIPTHDIASLMPEVRRFDPISALDGGSDGLMAYRQILKMLGDVLKPQGLFICEIGIHQHKDVVEIAVSHGLHLKETLEDLAGIPRTLVLAKP